MATLPPSPLSPSPPPPGSTSASQAVMPAWEHTKRVLFSPFSARKWLALGFIALLAGMMGGGGSPGGSFNMPGQTGGSSSGGGGGGQPPWTHPMEQTWHQVTSWFHAHLAQAVVGAVGVVLLGLLLGLLMTYISSVFRFIFLESVVTNEVRIRESWGRNEPEGRALFWWQIGFGLVSLLGVAVLVGLPTLLVVAAVTSRGQASALALGILGGLLAFVLGMVCVVVISLIAALTRDFVVPVMYLRRLGTLGAWREFWPVLTGNKMGFFVYFLMKIVCAIVAGLAAMVGACFGMLVAAIPIGALVGVGYLLVQALHITAWSWTYLWALVPTGVIVVLGLSYWMNCVLLPIPVFFQSYALRYLGMVRPELQTV